ncbi:transglutaminase domain-containing protein [Candidatus Curtissbacteria bacterium]|nr:transglutaminase domain-containing protein [Candidatus Curtissbacteria bacterium]
MKLIRRTFFLFLSFFAITFIANSNVSAEGEFAADYDVVYDVDINGKTKVSQNISLENNTNRFYATKFNLSLGQTKPENISASDLSGPLEVEQTFENNKTQLAVTFNQRVVGLGKKLNWKLNYDANELTVKNGIIWEISIPKLSKTDEVRTYNVHMAVPDSFGPVAFINPEPTKTEKATINGVAKTIYSFDVAKISQKGVSSSFGEKQIYKLNLTYHLKNDNLRGVYSEIALPPDNAYQRIYTTKIDPQPEAVTVDPDGNYIARFKLPAAKEIIVTYQGFAEVTHQPKDFPVIPLTEEQKHKYTQNDKYWDVTDPILREKASTLKTPKDIYDFVTTYLTYNEKRLDDATITRQGSRTAFDNPSNSVCMEFTDLFITFARMAGIPAREVNGYANTQNSRLRPLSLASSTTDILHAWPEYYDEERGWIQIDPTWGSTTGGLDFFTKLDFNHVTFTQKGYSSEYPLPAGSYKTSSDQKDVKVEFASEVPVQDLKINLKLDLPNHFIGGTSGAGTITLSNLGQKSVIDQKIIIETDAPISGSKSIKVLSLPAYSVNTYKFDLANSNFFTNKKYPIKVIYQDQVIQSEITIRPVFFSQIILYLILLLSGIGVTIFSLKKIKQRRVDVFPQS